MPFTPFHFGPGALVKSIMPSLFSFQVFVLSQVLIDIEPGLGLFLGWEELHAYTHNWPMAIVIAVAAFMLWEGWERYRPSRMTAPPIGKLVVAGSALFGTLSHVWFDSQFHREMAGMTPSNLMLWKTSDSATQIEIFCIAAALAAMVIWALRSLALMLWQSYRTGRSTN
jgi:CDP-diglyceride synthetase